MKEENWLTKVARHYLLCGSFETSPGLFDGRMGMVLFYFHYARYTGQPLYEDFAMELLESVYQGISVETPIGLARGLCGIGWGILHLQKCGFVEGSVDEILKDADHKIAEHHLLRMDDPSLESGFKGVALYLSERLPESENFEDSFKEEFKQGCLKHQWEKPASSLQVILEGMEQYGHEKPVKSWQKGLIYLCNHEETVHHQ